MGKLLSKTNLLLSNLGGWLLFSMMALLVIDVVWRNYFTPLHSMVELSVFAMMVIIYLGLAACEEEKEHVSLDFLQLILPRAMNTPHRILVAILNIVGGLILLYAVFLGGVSAYQRGEATIGNVTFPLWPVKFIMIAGTVFFVLEIIRTPFRKHSTKKSGPSQVEKSL